MLQIGRFKIHAIETGTFGLDGGAMFGIIPKPLWEKKHPTDEKNRIRMHLRAMLIQQDATPNQAVRNILVDCGMGNKWSEKQKNIYQLDHSVDSLEKSLANRGLQPADITDIILTHLHFDHVGGLTYRTRPNDPHCPLEPRFPNARVFIQKSNWNQAWNPNEKDRGSYLDENFLIYRDEPSLRRRLELLETPSTDPTGRSVFGDPDSQEDTVLPGITVEVSHGHTPGMQLVRVADAGQSIVYLADLIPTASHVRIPYIMGYDCYPIFVLKEKKRLLRRIVEEGSYVFYEHCPLMAVSRIGVTQDGNFEATHPLPSSTMA